ncbi:MAG: choice-of-anchor Q domain-containing protein [Coleofasciculus sp. G1-WW12-02]|uniref:choice-of-anchor Q domain-containing protein n=1 Tax=Coleofasciculus sp. G1-WW12-02 TaxID=3068483 RepID=UPI0032F796CD
MATFTVNNLFDSGTGSFRQAIFNANAQSGLDEIIFDTGGVPSTITLTSGALNIADSVNILGPGANLLTVSGNNNSRIFNINDGGSDILDVLISGLTLTNGNAQAADFNPFLTVGGGIFNADENLSLVDAVITNNTAFGIGFSYYGYTYSGEGRGGGIFNDSGNVTITNSIISGNKVSSDSAGYYYGGTGKGGGIFNNSGELTIVNSTINGNRAEGGYAPNGWYGGEGSGGGIFNQSGDLTIADSTISGNTATGGNGGPSNYYGYGYAGNGSGGGILNSSGNLTITNSTIRGNSAEGGDSRFRPGSAFGGGILNGSGNLIVDNSTISGNVAFGESSDYYGGSAYGGGILDRSGNLIVNNSTINGNSAYGGAAFGRDGGSAGGGGILGSGTITNSTISKNTAQGGSSFYSSGSEGYGGGISGRVTLINSTISGNTAQGGTSCLSSQGNGYGGGIFGRGEVFNSTITRNAASGGSSYCYSGNGIGLGSGIYRTNTLTITSSIVAGNRKGDDIFGGFTSGGNNLIGINPVLGGLKNNGGPTETHALLPGSPAIDAGSNPLGLLTDQRGSGFNRTSGSQTDIGAFEVQQQQPPSTSVPEPSSMLGLIGLVVIGTGSLLKRKLQDKS